MKDCDLVISHIPNLEALKNKRILITGATGMIGSAVAELLFRQNRKSDYNVDIYLGGRNEEGLSQRFTDFTGMYTYVHYEANGEHINYTFLDGLDYIIHCAGYGDPKFISEKPVDIIMNNVCGTNILLNLANMYKAKLLFVSSGEIYGKNIEADGRYIENAYGYVDVLNPRASYPNAKRLAESLCISHAKQYGTEVVIARSCHIYGPSIKDSDSRASAAFTREAISGNDIVMKSAGSQVRSYCYTLDCAGALLTILINGNGSEAYNISNINSIASIRELAETLAMEAGVNLIFENPSDSDRKSYNLMDNSVLDASKLESLGWTGVFDLNAGIRNTLKYYG